MKETQESISTWAADTFGEAGSNVRVAVRANEELSELLRALSVDDDNPKAAEEAADVLIVLYRLAQRSGNQVKHHTVGQLYDRTKFSPNFLWAVGVNHSMSNLLQVLALDDSHKRLDLYIDGVVSKLYRLASKMYFDLTEEVDKKMAVNRAREWQLDNTGHGYHVRDKEASVSVKS